MANEQSKDFDNRNASLVNEWPEWKRQYNIRVSAYTSAETGDTSKAGTIDKESAAPDEE